jgi:ribosomal protein S27E
MSDLNNTTALTTPAGFQFAEQWLNKFMQAAAPHFARCGYPLPPNTRVRIGLPSTGYRSNVIGECFAPSVSSDGHYEIYISPKVSEGDARIADILTHELCHAAASMNHDSDFKALARGLGLEGKLTATVAGPDWFSWAAPIIEALGPMDFAALGNIAPRKKKATFLLKVECPDCGWLARVTKTHIAPHTHLNCPNPECDGILVSDFGDTEGE